MTTSLTDGPPHSGRRWRWFGRAPSPRTIDILVVCTGNVCRSPFIAALLAAKLPGLTIRSAGTAVVAGQPPDAEILRALAERGCSQPRTSSAEALTRGMVRSANLIITATRLHRGLTIALDNGAGGRAFTLKELARVTSASNPPKGFAATVERAAQVALIADIVDYDDDLDDPHGFDWTAYERMATEVDVALRVVIPALASETYLPVAD